MLIKIFVTLFVAFAISRVFLRYKDGAIGILGTILWSLLWAIVEVFIWIPKISDVAAQKVGISSGVNALVYVSVVVLFYSIFRLYVKLEHVEHELTSLVRKMAIQKKEAQTTSSTSDSGPL